MPRTLLLRGSCTASPGTHVPGPGDSVSRGTPQGSESAEAGVAGMASDARAGILRRPEHLSADTCGPRNLQRGATCFPRNHEGPRHVRTPLPQGCTHLWTTTLRWGSAFHKVVHNGGQAPFCTLACTDGTGLSPGTRATRGWGGKTKTRASTPRAPNGADTHSVYGRSVCTVTPLTLERGPFH